MRSTASAAAALLAVAALVFLLPGCGGGGGGGGEAGPPAFAGYSTSIGSLDGWVRSDGSFNALDFPRVGDLDLSVPGERITACYAFDTSAIPPGATIHMATLTVQVVGHDGDPYAQHGDMEAQYLPYGDSLANAPMIAVFNPPAPAVLSPSSVALGAKTADVRAILQRSLNDGNARLQVEVGFFGQFALVNGVDDIVMLTDGEGSVPGGVVPGLAFTWSEP